MFVRHPVLTHKGTQIKMASTFLLWFLVFCTVLAAVFFLQFSENASHTQGMRIHDQLITKLLLVEQAKDLALWYGGIILAFAILMWIYMMVYSHRLTGPIYKLEKLLERCVHNKTLPDETLNFRKTDAFHELAELFNEFIKESCKKELNVSPKSDE